DRATPAFPCAREEAPAGTSRPYLRRCPSRLAHCTVRDRGMALEQSRLWRRAPGLETWEGTVRESAAYNRIARGAVREDTSHDEGIARVREGGGRPDSAGQTAPYGRGSAGQPALQSGDQRERSSRMGENVSGVPRIFFTDLDGTLLD